MNGPINGAGTGSFTSSLKAISDLGKTTVSTVSKLQGIEFSDLIEQQNAIPGLLEELKGLLPEQDFSQIEAFIIGGNGLPPAAVSGSEFELMPGESTLPLIATLAVASQQRAAAQIAGEVSAPEVRLPFSETGLLPVLNTGKFISADAHCGIGPATATAVPATATAVPAAATAVPATATAVPGSAEQTVTGLTAQLLSADLEPIARSRRSALQESSALGVTINPMSALKAAEAATTMRFSSPALLALDTPLAGKGWEQGVGDRIMWMLGNSVQGVSLKISPAHLGPIDIKLSMHLDQATVTFHAQHAVVREALEASIPRLREMFQDNNLQLAHVDVGQRGHTGQQAADGRARNGQNGVAGDVAGQSEYDGADREEPVIIQSAVDGLLNDYA